jgi:hypothetical protein
MALNPRKMVAPQPQDARLHLVEDLAADLNVSPPVLAGLCRAKGWASGKQVTQAEFAAALEAFQTRPLGGGRI